MDGHAKDRLAVTMSCWPSAITRRVDKVHHDLASVAGSHVDADCVPRETCVRSTATR